MNKDKDRNRHFLLTRTVLDGVWWWSSFIFGFVCWFYYFCCFHFKAKYNRCLHLCLLFFPPPRRHFISACVLLSLLSLCLQESIWYNVCKCYSWPLMQKLDRIISLLCNSHNIIASLSWLISSFWKGYLKENNSMYVLYKPQCLILSCFSFKERMIAE